jgi:hypothetical protein
MISVFKADEILHSVDVDASSRSEHINDAPNKKQRRILKHELFIERMWRLSSTHSQTIIIFIPFHHHRPFLHLLSSYFIFGGHARAAIGYVTLVPWSVHQIRMMYGWGWRAGGATHTTHRSGSVTRTIFKIAYAQTETQGEGAAGGRLRNLAGGPSIHRPDSCYTCHDQRRQ